MSRFIMPIILIGIAITVFFVFTNPMYNNMSDLKAQIASYNDALSNSKELETERDALTTKYNNMDPNNLDRLQKLLPDNVDNIRLILEIEQIAAPYGMTLTDIKYDASDDGTTTPTSPGTSTTTATPTVTVQGGAISKTAAKTYGTFDLDFSVSGTYDNFINFTKDLENNLRIVDISSVAFSSDSTASSAPTGTTVGASTKANSPDIYKYDFAIQTYWLKN